MPEKNVNQPQSLTIVIFGASGDLTKRKLVPALYNNYAKGRLPECPRIVGVSRTEYSHEEFREKLKEDIQEFAPDHFDGETWDKFERNIFYIPADAATDEGLGELKSGLEDLEGEIDADGVNRIYYLSVTPKLYEPIIANLGEHDMVNEANGAFRRVVIEKPFGFDLESARKLNRAVHKVFDESQVYRIDHYLGKETAQNILYYRFANTINEPIWNRNYIESVEITVAESVDVGRRAEYYDSSGVLRDMFQNHLLQLLMLVAMEPPSAFEATPLRNEKVKVLQSVRPIRIEDTVRARYEGYRETEGVAEDSITPTFVALKLFIDNWRWQDVPFYLRSGKAMSTKNTQINIVFKDPPQLLFQHVKREQIQPNVLSLCIQPDEGIHQTFLAKVPDTGSEMQKVDMEFHYRTAFNGQTIPDSYERLLLDAINGDAQLFTRSDEIETAWGIIDPILEGWESRPPASPLVEYARGTWGPEQSDTLLSREGHRWHMGCLHENEDDE